MSFSKTFVLLLSYHFEPGLIKVFFFFFEQSKSSSCKGNFLIVAKTVIISPHDYNLQWQTFIPLSLLPTTLFLCLLVRHSFSTQVLKKCIILVSSILYRIPFFILHISYYDYRESRVEANSPHVPPESLVLQLPDSIACLRYFPSGLDPFSGLLFQTMFPLQLMAQLNSCYIGQSRLRVIWGGGERG